MNILKATKAYEAWLRARIPLLETDLRLKHQRMAASPFAFLRATFYRWVQLWPRLCPELMTTPVLLSVGDLHVENFGTWRDLEGRLIWGTNDFDEVARMPYTIDLVRLAVSAQLAIRENHLSCDQVEACDAILEGYRQSLKDGGAPYVLAEQHRWLRDLALSELRDPGLYWQKLDQLPTVRTGLPAEVRAGLTRALPEPARDFRVVHRHAGLGSLGRRRLMALTRWRGGYVAREAKELVASAWYWQKECAGAILYQRAIDSAVRVPDPHVAQKGRWVIRRLAPDCGRIELALLPAKRDELRLLNAMGWETANVHLGSKSIVSRVRKDLNRRPANWLRRSAEAMAKATVQDWKEWARL